MAEALAVVAVVSSIVQLVDFGSKVLLRLNDFQSSAREVPKAFQQIRAELPVLIDTLQDTKVAIETGSLRDGTKEALLPVIDGCRTQVQALDVLVSKVLPLPEDSWRERSRKAVSSLRQDAKVKKIRTDIQGYVQTLTYYHAAASSTLRPPIGVSSFLRPTPSSTVPFRRDLDFVDRDVLSDIHKKCSLPAGRVALVGLGGVGKSQLAIQYSYQVRDSSPDIWVFWVHAGTAARFEEGYRIIAERAKILGWEKPESDNFQLVHNWLCDESNGRWVMIVDNADDASVFFSQSEDHGAAQDTRSLSDFLPQSPNGSVLITSRNRDVAFRLTGRDSDIIPIGPMDETDALTLLLKKLPSHISSDCAAELVQSLDCMPLAVTQAAAYVSQRTPRITISKYLQAIRESDEGKAMLLKKDTGDTRRDSKATNSIIATWMISFEHIRKVRLSAARLLSIMSLFDRQGIPEDLLRHSYQDNSNTEADFEDDISTLITYSLVKMNLEGSDFEMHRLVQFSTKTWLEHYDELEDWKTKYIKTINRAFPNSTYDNQKLCQSLLPHAEMALSYRPGNEAYLIEWANILMKAASYCSSQGNYYMAEQMNRLAVEVKEKTLGMGHPQTLTSVNNLATVLGRQGKYEQAEEMSRRALEGKEKALGMEHPDTLTSVNNLASILSSKGENRQAEEMMRRVLEAREKTLGDEHPDTLTSLSLLAYFIQQQSRYGEALSLYQRANNGFEKRLGLDHPTTKTCLEYTSWCRVLSSNSP